MRAEKKKKLETRKHKAIRRTVIFFVWLLLAASCHLYGIFPMQAVRDTEENYNTGRTQAVRRMAPPAEIKVGARLFYLTANEHAVLLSAVQFHPLYGWLDSTGAPLDCSRKAPVYAGVWAVHNGEGESKGVPSAYYIFGRVDEPDIAKLRIRVQYLDETQSAETYRDAFFMESGRRAWTMRDGRQYFVLSKVLGQDDWAYDSRLYFTAEALNAAGDVVYTLSDQDMMKSYASLG